MEISIIIPVYNVERYLKKCMDSILVQSFQDFEVILVNDGSVDESGSLCEEYARKYANIRAIHKENEGVAAARNTGIEASRGEYITFIDPDDYVEKHYLEVLYRIITKQTADLAICDGEIVPEGRGETAKAKDSAWEEGISGAEVISRSEAYRRMLLGEHMCIAVWAKLYRKSLFREVRYPKGEICEDTHILDRIIESCGKIVCTPYKGHFVRFRRESGASALANPGRERTVFSCFR